MTDTDIDVYYGIASGQQRSALRRLEPDRVMISHATKHNSPIPGDYELMIDCGGYHHMVNGSGEYDDSDAEYLEYVLKTRPRLYALRDYPCEPDLLEQLGRGVEEQQRRTIDRHRSLLDMVSGHHLADRAVTVLQGWTVDQYLAHLDDHREAGTLTDHVAVGSVCRRGQDEEIAEVLLAVCEALSSQHTIHAFGIKSSVLRYREVCEAIDSCDSAAYDYAESRGKRGRTADESFTWRDSARAYLNFRHDIEQTMGTESLHNGSRQITLA